MKVNVKYLMTTLIVILGVVLFYYRVFVPKTTFQTLIPTKGSIEVNVAGIGNVDAKDTYAITAQMGGKILAIYKDIGDWVKKGDLLIEVDGVDLPEQLAIAQANLQKTNYDVKAAVSDLTNQKSRKELLQLTYKRVANLKKRKLASQAEFDKSKADLESVDAAINAAVAHIDAAKAASVVAIKTIDALDAKIQRLKVYAPIDGYVVNKTAQVAQNVLPATTILSIVDPTTLWVVSKVDERISASIKPGQSATIKLRSQPEKTYQGIVKRINALSDAVTLEREIDIAFLEIPEPFYINEQAQVSITTKQFDNLVKIPANVLVQNGGKLGVWTVKEFTAHFVVLDIVARDTSDVGVKNFSIKTKIIIPNAHKKPLKEGMKIHL